MAKKTNNKKAQGQEMFQTSEMYRTASFLSKPAASRPALGPRIPNEILLPPSGVNA